MIFIGGTTIEKHLIRPRWTTIGILTFICLSILTPSLVYPSRTNPAPWDRLYLYPLNHSQRTILYVGGSGPNNYTKIQDAVDNASPDDTIFVYQGMYYEHVTLNKQVTLLGELRDQTIIDGSKTGNVIKITADGVTVQQFTLQNAGIGVYIVHSSNQNIIQNNIKNNWEGIGLLDSAHNTISGNIITYNGFEGINPVQTTFTVIQDNTIIDHLQGISLSESTGNTIVRNNFFNNLRGIEIQQSSNNNKIVHNNFFSSEDTNGYDSCSNTWDDGYPSGGNFWDDYTGGDANHDGIGDTPYNIAGGGGNKDHYPLMESWNQPPVIPTINGTTSGTIGQAYAYTFVTTDPEKTNVFYYIDWGDGANSGWIGPNQSGQQITVFHTWSKRGIYTVKAKAKDVYNAESDWGVLKIRMPKNQIHQTALFVHFFERLFERFPHAFPIRQYLHNVYGLHR